MKWHTLDLKKNHCCQNSIWQTHKLCEGVPSYARVHITSAAEVVVTPSKLAQNVGESSFELSKTHGIPLEDAKLKMLGYIGRAKDMVLGLKATVMQKSVAASWEQPETLARLSLGKALEGLIGHHGHLLKGAGKPAPAAGPLVVSKALKGLISFHGDLQCKVSLIS